MLGMPTAKYGQSIATDWPMSLVANGGENSDHSSHVDVLAFSR
jgi:hypothetical protein